MSQGIREVILATIDEGIIRDETRSTEDFVRGLRQ
jgi:hypothetical protein